MRLGRWIWQQLQVCYISCGWGFLLRFSLFSVTAVWFFWFFMFSRGAFSSCCLFGWHQVGKEHFGPSCSSSPFCTSGAWLLMLCCFKKNISWWWKSQIGLFGVHSSVVNCGIRKIVLCLNFPILPSYRAALAAIWQHFVVNSWLPNNSVLFIFRLYCYRISAMEEIGGRFLALRNAQFWQIWRDFMP